METFINKNSNLINIKGGFNPKEVIEKEIKNRFPSLDINTEQFKIATILIASVSIGADRKRIAKLLEITEKDILKYEKNLRKNKIWVGKKVNSHSWTKKKGIIAFWMDISIGLGILNKEDRPMCLKK